MCGELRISDNYNARSSGSSPRVWGTALHAVNDGRVNRFIPTCVGNCRLAIVSHQFISVHPHVCGELLRYVLIDASLTGSSPRVWGTGYFWLSLSELLWFIPTCVGNCTALLCFLECEAVHPHVCGELFQTLYQPLRTPGSSPRVWGTVVLYTQHH